MIGRKSQPTPDVFSCAGGVTNNVAEEISLILAPAFIGGIWRGDRISNAALKWHVRLKRIGFARALVKAIENLLARRG